MLFATIGQAYVFLATVYGGLAIGLIQDVTAFVRGLLGAGRRVTFAIDVAFWLGVAAVAFLVLLYASDGDLRFYMLLGFAAGFALYRLSLYRIVSTLLKAIERAVRAIVAWLLRTRLVKKLFR